MVYSHCNNTTCERVTWLRGRFFGIFLACPVFVVGTIIMRIYVPGAWGHVNNRKKHRFYQNYYRLIIGPNQPITGKSNQCLSFDRYNQTRRCFFFMFSNHIQSYVKKPPEYNTEENTIKMYRIITVHLLI